MKKIISVILLIIFLSLPIYSIAVDNDEIDYIWLQETITSAKEINEPVIYSKAAVIYDRASKTKIYGKNENERLPMASTTKIMTAILLVENRDLEETVEVVREAAIIGGSSLELKTGDKLTFESLLYGLMLCSGNDAAAQIAISIAGSIEEFADLMNWKAESLGLVDTHFITPHGLDEEGHYTTAYELAVMADYALNIPKIAEVVSTKTKTISINGYPRTLVNTNELLGYLEGVNGVKTGFTSNAGRCLVTSCARNGFNIITVVLGADTKRIRTKDSINLIEYTYKKYQLVDLEDRVLEEFEKWEHINKNRINIIKGTSNNINVKLGNIKYKKYPIEKEKLDTLVIQSNIQKTSLEAPVKADFVLGNIEVQIGEEIVMSVEIRNKYKIERKNVFDYMRELVNINCDLEQVAHLEALGGFAKGRVSKTVHRTVLAFA